jgi:hypothetical protein
MRSLSRDYVRRMVRDGQAVEVGLTCSGARWPEGTHYVIVNIPSRHTVAHYEATDRDEERLIPGGKS